MKAVVIGGSGHIGNAIVRELLTRKCLVTVCGRRKKPPANLTSLRIRYLSGEAEAPRQFDKWIAGHDLVVDAAAPYPVGIFPTAKEPTGDPIVRAEIRTRRLLDAVAKHRTRLIYIGSCVTLAKPRTQAQCFQAKLLKAAHPYFSVKELIENQIIDASRHGIQAVIVDPTYCLGPWDIRERQYCTIPLLLKGEIPSSISQVLYLVDVRDVAAATMSALDREFYGEPILTTAYQMPTQELYSVICETAGVSPPRYSFPTQPVMGVAYILEVLLGFAGLESPLSSGAIMISTTFDYLEPTMELQDLGVTPRSLSETISDSISWYRQLGYC